ncbi:ABC transporter substrate-binding protein [Neoroseomonas oryzicola]|uniref:ABC transporter substrate-binding protein n=1 Tax=Neoroseomonas oryzicola TaxID=535904 RepID=A0A9X9WMA8_9PROT|nr:ABC transporter substrate-binding protein [Neoroseomonas oryzicola]MBR0661468.1 ABC transporter substrate-binding protein [Neoroseomonas oryzicola]NKE19955.1 ABC transporter substrate-binding protein [Neoroseomonas oryzicola]
MRLIPAAAAALMLAAAPAALAKSFTWSFSSDILTLDPHASNNTFTNAFLDNVYETLVRHNQRLELEPALATRWEVVSPTLWRFHLREGVRFHNGETFGAEDVVFSWQRLNTPGALARGVLTIIKEVRATGPLTVEIETERPFPILLNALTQMHILDAGWAAANNATAATNLQAREETGASRMANGTGPFRVRSRELDRSTVLEPFAGWWDTPQHNLTEVTFQPIRSAPTRTAALLGGQVDALVELPLQDISRIEANPTLQVVQGPELRTIYLGFDHFRDELVYSDVRGRNPLKDIRVRRAIYQAIDVETLRRSVMRNNAWIAGTMASPFLNGAPTDINTRTFPFDPDAAKRLLAEAGYPDGFSVGLACPNDRYVYDERLCIAISGMLQRVGIRIIPQFETVNLWSRRINNLDVSMFMVGHAGLPLADTFSTLSEVLRTRTATGAGLNVGRWSNAEFDALVDRIAEEGDEPTRRALIRQALLIEKREVAHVPLHQQPVVWASRRNIDLAQSPDNRLRLRYVRVN